MEKKVLSELRDMQFTIPFLQRGYKWTDTHVEKLLLDLKEFIDSGKPMYCLQPLAVAKGGDEKQWRVLDGQQRLTTLFMLHFYLFRCKPYTLNFERDGDDFANRRDFLEHINERSEAGAQWSIDCHFFYKAYKKIESTFATNEAFAGYKDKFRTLLNAEPTQSSVQVLWYVVDAEKEHQIFSHLNTGKIQLTNTELIKALFLNRASGLPQHQRAEAATHFDQMAQAMQNNSFWAMFCTREPEKGQVRMDFLFNLVAEGATEDKCSVNPRWSFENYFDSPEHGTLAEKWAQVRHTFLRMWDMYNDIEVYHYVGFLAYCHQRNELHNARKLLKWHRESTHTQFLKRLQDEIKHIVCTDDLKSVESYSYGTDKKQLRQLFLLHNIETIISNYCTLNQSNSLQQGYEHFPFELLHCQAWDIEHIASATDCDFANKKDRQIWLKGKSNEISSFILGKLVKADNEKETEVWQGLQKRCNKLADNHDHSADEFNTFCRDFNSKYVTLVNTDKSEIIAEEPEQKQEGDNTIYKNNIGNITLLDAHTNRSYQNAIFPRKRCCVIEAKTYIPPCTRAVFYKTYRKDAALNMNDWTQSDARAYVDDIKAKLNRYFV